MALQCQLQAVTLFERSIFPGSVESTYLDDMDVRDRIAQRFKNSIVTSDKFGKIKRTFPSLEATFIEMRFEITFFQPCN